MFDLPKDVLKKLVTTRNTAPERLTPSETVIADRIEFCTLCEYLWVRRKKASPPRCPSCHKLGWNRPLINAMLAAHDAEAAKKGGTP